MHNMHYVCTLLGLSLAYCSDNLNGQVEYSEILKFLPYWITTRHVPYFLILSQRKFNKVKHPLVIKTLLGNNFIRVITGYSDI